MCITWSMDRLSISLRHPIPWEHVMHYYQSVTWICGPEESGKTTRIARLLRSNRSKSIMAVRYQVSKDASEQEDVTRHKNELQRYDEAGAILTKFVTRPPEESARGLFYDPDDDDIVTLCEGPSSIGAYMSSFAYVMRPLAEGEELLDFGKKEVMHLSLQQHLVNTGIVTPEEMEELPDEEEEEEWDEEDGVIEEEFDLPEEAEKRLISWIKDGVPYYTDKWSIREPHQALGKAGIVVINIHSETERPRAEDLAREIRRLNQDEKIKRDLNLGYGGHQRVSIYISNLADPKDPELKKAIARIKRVWTG